MLLQCNGGAIARAVAARRVGGRSVSGETACSAAETCSGGEKTILGEAISLALSTLACRRSGVDRPTLVRDESGAALDADKAVAYVAMLRRAAEMIGADRVLLVSHAPKVQALCDARVEV